MANLIAQTKETLRRWLRTFLCYFENVHSFVLVAIGCLVCYKGIQTFDPYLYYPSREMLNLAHIKVCMTNIAPLVAGGILILSETLGYFRTNLQYFMLGIYLSYMGGFYLTDFQPYAEYIFILGLINLALSPFKKYRPYRPILKQN
eukprot:305777_1